MLILLLLTLFAIIIIIYICLGSEIKAIFYKIEPGDEIYYFESNPFCDVKQAKVVDVKKGRYGEKWIQYKMKDVNFTYSYKLSYMLECGWRKVK